jgi:hypothetical protein
VLHPSKFEVEELVALQGVSLQCTQPQLLEGLDNRIEASSGGNLGAGALARSPSVVTMKSILPKHTRAPRVQSMSWLAIQSLMEATKCTKAPT